MERAQAMILGNCRVTIAEIAARMGINVTVLGANFKWWNYLYATLTRHKWTTTVPHSQHVIV
jgi:hypothetical protein